MKLHPIITNESLLLDIECKRLIKRKSRQDIINYVMFNLTNLKTVSNQEINNNLEIQKKNNFNILEQLLIILGCNNIN